MRRTSSNCRCGGFTLVELLVAILASSLVMLAALSYMLVGMRVETKAVDTMDRQRTSRVVLTLLENLTTNNRVAEIQTVGGRGDDWVILDQGRKPLIRYRSADHVLLSGTDGILMDELASATAELNGSLLTFSLETGGEVYTASVYCRLVPNALTYGTEELLDKASDSLEDTQSGRYQFLALLASQYGSHGEILEGQMVHVYDYFTEWYVKEGLEEPSLWYENGGVWKSDTPWCAVYVSWAAAHVTDTGGGRPVLNTVPLFANVDTGMYQFGGPKVGDAVNLPDTEGGIFGSWRDPNDPEDIPLPGDLVFFDWDGDGDTQHVGTVLFVDEGSDQIYTIEGNSDNKVAVRCYAMDDPDIVGYGVLDWMPQNPISEP